MKTAQLHDGRTLTFPDTHTPEMIKKHVKGVLDKEEKDKRARENDEKAKQESKEKQQKDTEERRHKEILEGSSKQMAVMQIIAVGLQEIAKSMPDVSPIVSKIDVLSKSVQSLEKALTKASDRHVKLAMAPDVVERDSKGRATGKRKDYKDN